VTLTARIFMKKENKRKGKSSMCMHSAFANEIRFHSVKGDRNDHETFKIIFVAHWVPYIATRTRISTIAVTYYASALHCLQFSIRSLNSSICNVISKNLYLSWIFRVAVRKMLWGLVPGSASKNIALF